MNQVAYEVFALCIAALSHPVCFLFLPACAVGAQWEAYHRSCREEPLRCLCVRGQQHCGSEGEQSGSAVCAG